MFDTLYQLKNKQLIPYLNLNFKNKGLAIDRKKDVYIMNIFCYDIKLGEGHNMKDGYMDDSVKEEPNPTLYIGT